MFAVASSTVASTVTGSTGRSTGNIYMLIGERDVSLDQVRLTLNGNPEGSTTDGTSGDLTGSNMRLARYSGGTTQRTAMGFYTAAVWRRLLSADELAALEAWRVARFT